MRFIIIWTAGARLTAQKALEQGRRVFKREFGISLPKK
jgi:hypothetical protein